jgi:hypothetical protein
VPVHNADIWLEKKDVVNARPLKALRSLLRKTM